MTFWKRTRWICSAVLIAVWLVAVPAAAWQGECDLPAKPTACTSNCL